MTFLFSILRKGFANLRSTKGGKGVEEGGVCFCLVRRTGNAFQVWLVGKLLSGMQIFGCIVNWFLCFWLQLK